MTRPDAVWRCRDFRLPVGQRCHVMGILNITPDSFSDGGNFLDPHAAVRRGVAMVADGADILDVGGESTRPGADPVSEADELQRVLPVIRTLAARVDVPISIDTTKASVAAAALEAGAAIVNDVTALRADPAMARVVAAAGAGVVLMHMLGEPRTMQKDPRYNDVLAEVSTALAGWAATAEAAGIPADRIVVDPGIGFGKTLRHNLLLLNGLSYLQALGYPVLVGPSRKSFMGTAFGLDVAERLEATAGSVGWCAAQGAAVVRVHDVKEMVRVVRMVDAIRDVAPAPPPAPVAPAAGLPATAVPGAVPWAWGERAWGEPAWSDRVLVRGLRVFGHHGVHARERQEGQHFVVDIEAALDLGPAARRDELSATLDYSALAQRVAGIVAGERYSLIEALAERLAAMVLEDPRVQRVMIRVAKPEALAGLSALGATVEDAAVQIERRR